MTIADLGLSDQELIQLRRKADKLGVDAVDFVRQVVRHELNRLTWDEIAAPLQEKMQGHGMSEEESLAFFEAERAAMHAERRSRSLQDPGNLQ